MAIYVNIGWTKRSKRNKFFCPRPLPDFRFLILISKTNCHNSGTVSPLPLNVDQTFDVLRTLIGHKINKLLKNEKLIETPINTYNVHFLKFEVKKKIPDY